MPGSDYLDHFGSVASQILKGDQAVARGDKANRAKFWVDRDLGGVSLLRAEFGTMSFPRHVHSELVIAVTEICAFDLLDGWENGSEATRG